MLSAAKAYPLAAEEMASEAEGGSIETPAGSWNVTKGCPRLLSAVTANFALTGAMTFSCSSVLTKEAQAHRMGVDVRRRSFGVVALLRSVPELEGWRACR